jgi:homocysteine S-methyltransferase
MIGVVVSALWVERGKKLAKSRILSLAPHFLQQHRNTIQHLLTSSTPRIMTSSKTPLPPVLLLDGGLGTTLADQYGCAFNDTTPLWSSDLLLTNPSLLLEAQTAFAGAGTDIILTATYQASYSGFAQSGASRSQAQKAMRRAVVIACNSFSGDSRGYDWGRYLPISRIGKGKVALSLGAYGATMVPSQEYSGKYDEEHVTVEQLREWHKERIDVFRPFGFYDTDSISRRPGVREDVELFQREDCWDNIDFVAFETLPLLREIVAVREAMKYVWNTTRVGYDSEVGDSEKGFWISCVFPGEGNTLPDGSSVKDVVGAMLEEKEGAARPMGVGINCTKIVKLESLIEEFESAIRDLVETESLEEPVSLVVYPDGTNGEVYNTTTKEWEKAGDGNESSVSSAHIFHICYKMF